MTTQPLSTSQFDNKATSPHEQECDDQNSARAESNDGIMHFRQYLLIQGSRTLLRNGETIPLGSRAFDLLAVLLRARGTVVSKDQIYRHVWQSRAVEESNLRFQMTALRRILGPDRDIIKTIPGRGYLLKLETGDLPNRSYVQEANDVAARQHNIPPLHVVATEGVVQRATHDDETAEVVLIDDDADTREALQSLLRSAGLHVDPFPSVTAFLASTRASLPRCMILDVWLPGQNGLDFQAEMVKAGIHLPIIFISGHADVHMSVRAMKAGAIEFLTKPVRYQDLLNAIQAAVAAARPNSCVSKLCTVAPSR